MSQSPTAVNSPVYQGEYKNRLVQYKPLTAENSRINGRSVKQDNTKGKSPKGRNVGKLSGLMEMPMDVFYEITSFLLPKDILQLSRASSYFRELLTTKNARPYWRAARRNINMPDCTPDLSEMQYAAMVFECNCCACGVNRSVKFSCSLKLRFCGACWDTNVSKGKKFMKRHNDKLKPRFRLDHVISTLLISAEDGNHRKYYVYRADDPIQVFKPTDHHREKFSFYQPEFEEILERYLEVRADDSALAEFLKERQQIICDTLQFVRIFSKWELNYSTEEHRENQTKNIELSAMRKDKAGLIKEKLIGLGYTQDDFPHDYDRDWRRLLAARGELTDKYWDKNLFPKLKDAIETKRKNDLLREAQERIELRKMEFQCVFLKLQFPPATILPNLRELLQSTFLLPFLEENEALEVVTEERVAVIIDELNAFVKEFNDHFKAAICRPIPAHALTDFSIGTPNFPMEKYPAMIFRCQVDGLKCKNAPNGRLMSYQMLTEHINVEHSQPYRRLTLPDHSSFVIDFEASELAMKILEHAGLPKNATYDTLKELQQKGNVVCFCGHPQFQQPASFLDLLEHIVDENEWFKNAKASGNPSATFHNDHPITNLQWFIAVLPHGKSIDSLISASKSPKGSVFIGVPARHCRYCPRIKENMDRATMIWHMNSKHLKHATDSDLESSPWYGRF